MEEVLASGPNGKVEPVEKPLVVAVSRPRVVLLDRKRPADWALLAQATKRIREFPARYPGTENNGEIMARWAEVSFTSEKPSCLLIVAEQDGIVIGHLFGTVLFNEFSKQRYTYIYQYECDCLPEDLKRTAGEMLENWSIEHETEEIRLECVDQKTARAYQIFYEFEPLRLIMHRKVRKRT